MHEWLGLAGRTFYQTKPHVSIEPVCSRAEGGGEVGLTLSLAHACTSDFILVADRIHHLGHVVFFSEARAAKTAVALSHLFEARTRGLESWVRILFTTMFGTTALPKLFNNTRGSCACSTSRDTGIFLRNRFLRPTPTGFDF